MFDLEVSDAEGSPNSLEGRFDFPATPVNEDMSKQFLTMDPEEEDKMMKTAASEIAKSLDLPVRKLLLGVYTSFVLACGTGVFKTSSSTLKNRKVSLTKPSGPILAHSSLIQGS